MDDTEFRALSHFCYIALGVLLAIFLISIAGICAILFFPDPAFGWVLFGIIVFFLVICLQYMASTKLEGYWHKAARTRLQRFIPTICAAIIVLVVYSITKLTPEFVVLFTVALYSLSTLQNITQALKEIRCSRDT